MAGKSKVDPDWVNEANAVIKDIEPHVAKILLSNLPSSKQKIYFNLTTLEKNDFCIELTPQGFNIVGEKYDSKEKKGKYTLFETPYTLLNSLSPAYRDSFGQQLLQKLNKLREDREKEEEENRRMGKEHDEDR